MKARLSLLHKTEVEWLKLKTFIPDAGEVIIYDPDEHFTYSRIKIGDGQQYLIDLPFVLDAAILEFLSTIKYYEVLDGGRITAYK